MEKNAKNMEGGEEGSLPSNSHFCHHLEAPLAGGTLEVPMDFVLLKLWATQALSRLEALVSAKVGREWGERVSRMREVGGLVGRRVVGASQKTLGVKGGPKKNDKITVP